MESGDFGKRRTGEGERGNWELRSGDWGFFNLLLAIWGKGELGKGKRERERVETWSVGRGSQQLLQPFYISCEIVKSVRV